MLRLCSKITSQITSPFGQALQTPNMLPLPIAPSARGASSKYAVIYPQRAALNRLGRLPDNITFGPPDAHLV